MWSAASPLRNFFKGSLTHGPSNLCVNEKTLRVNGTNQNKGLCDFLLVRHRPSNLGLILYRLEILEVFVLLSDPNPINPFNPNFWGVPVAPDRHGGVSPHIGRSAVKLFSKNSNLCDHDSLPFTYL